MDDDETRFAYVALFRSHLQEMWALPCFYQLHVLEARGHVEYQNGLVRLTDAGIAYWVEQIKGRWSPNQKMSKELKELLDG